MDGDEELTERVRRAFEKVPDTVEQRMFGSLGFLVGGALRVGVGAKRDHVMMVRIAPESVADALLLAGAHPAVMRGSTMRGWVFLTPEAVETDAQVEHWVALSLAAV